MYIYMYGVYTYIYMYGVYAYIYRNAKRKNKKRCPKIC